MGLRGELLRSLYRKLKPPSEKAKDRLAAQKLLDFASAGIDPPYRVRDFRHYGRALKKKKKTSEGLADTGRSLVKDGWRKTNRRRTGIKMVGIRKPIVHRK